MSAVLLSAKGLVCGYPGKHVLDGVDLEIKEGERVVLLGPNGSGKSTLLRTLSGLLKPLAGEALLNGEQVGRLSASEIARGVAVVPQEESTRFSFRVREMVTMGRLARSNGLLDTAEDREIATKAMATADCLDLADRPITELSGGERQRVLIARALAQEAPLLLLDEPTSHLDPAHQLQTIRLVRGLADHGIATVAAVHDLNLARLIADRAILLEQGKIGFSGPVEDVLNSPILDRVYGVPFERTYLLDGGTFVALPGSLAASAVEPVYH